MALPVVLRQDRLRKRPGGRGERRPSRLSGADLDAIAAELNGRPRQTLDFKTPSQALIEALR
jgi:hypothetical protein